MGGNEFVGGLDFYYKFHDMLIGIGASINDGPFYYFTVGYNDKYFEFGTFAGIFHQLVHVRCKGTEDGYIFSSNRRELYGSLFWGLYASTFYKNIFFNYSLSGYNSYFEVKKISVDVSTILSNYFTLGYYLNKRISITVGAVGTKGRFDMHWAASFGVNFHPL